MSDFVNEQFINSIDQLKSKGTTFKSIADTLGIDQRKISSIKGGRSSASYEMLQALYQAYPEISPEGEEVNTEDIETINAQLKQVLNELQTNNQLLREIKKDLEKEETRSEAINRLSKIIEQQMKDQEE